MAVTESKKKLLSWADWLRAVASIAVMVAHARAGHWLPYSEMEAGSKSYMALAFVTITRPGAEWVAVFFFLSGYLISKGVGDQLRNGTFDATRYFCNRAARIYAPLLPALLLSLALSWTLNSPASASDFFGNLLNLQGAVASVRSFAGNNVLWSLPYEWWLYVAFGTGVAICSDRKWRPWNVAGIVMAGLVLANLRSVHIVCWAVGVVTAQVATSRKLETRAAFLLGLAITLAGFVASQLSSPTADNLMQDDFLRSCGLVSICLGLSVMSYRLGADNGEASSGTRWLGVKLAGISYSLYLTHYPLLRVFSQATQSGRHGDFGPQSIMIFALKCTLCMLVAAAFWWLFERHTPAIARYLHEKLRGRPAGS